MSPLKTLLLSSIVLYPMGFEPMEEGALEPTTAHLLLNRE
jgi:hypothetical protein